MRAEFEVTATERAYGDSLGEPALRVIAEVRGGVFDETLTMVLLDGDAPELPQVGDKLMVEVRWEPRNKQTAIERLT